MRRPCLLFAIGVVALLCATCFPESHVILAAGPAWATFRIPAECPTGLPVLLHGELQGDPGTGTVFVLSDRCKRGRCWIAQRDQLTGDLSCFVTLCDGHLPGACLRFFAQPGCSNQAVTIEPEGKGFQFRDCGRPVLFYQKELHSLDGGKHTSANYVHPVFGLDGENLTQDFPKDHPHHHGIFWAWHQLWVGDKRVGDAWANVDFLPVVKNADIVEQGPLFATLRVLVDWTSPLLKDSSGKTIPFVEEETSIRLYGSLGDFQYLDFTTTLKALLDGVRIGGSEDAKGYSGFTVRLSAPKDIAIVTDSGRLTADAVLAPSRWVDVSGHYTDADAVSGVAIVTHPTLPEFPPRWLFRHYGPQNVSYPGREAVPIPKDRPLTLRHRIVLHRGDTQQARVADHQKIFESSGLTNEGAPAKKVH